MQRLGLKCSFTPDKIETQLLQSVVLVEWYGPASHQQLSKQLKKKEPRYSAWKDEQPLHYMMLMDVFKELADQSSKMMIQAKSANRVISDGADGYELYDSDRDSFGSLNSVSSSVEARNNSQHPFMGEYDSYLDSPGY